MAEGDCEACSGWGQCQKCKANPGTLLDGSDCECTYGSTPTIGQCIGCAGTGDSANAVDPKFIEGLRRAREEAAPRRDTSSLPDPKTFDWDALFGNQNPS